MKATREPPQVYHRRLSVGSPVDISVTHLRHPYVPGLASLSLRDRPLFTLAALHIGEVGPICGPSLRYRKRHINTSFQAGKYLVSPLVKTLPDGRYAASVSIRSGFGSASHDRVLRLERTFDNPHSAVRYAADQGMAWVGSKSRSRYTPMEA